MFDDEEEITGSIIKDRSDGFYVVKNVMVDKWLRIIGPEAFSIWHLFKSMCKGKGEVVFLKVRQVDWAEYCGMKLPIFQKYLKILSDTGLVHIEKPSGVNRLRHYATTYILQDPPEKIPDDIIKKYKVTPFSSDCRFIDPLLAEQYTGEKILRGGSSVQTKIKNSFNNKSPLHQSQPDHMKNKVSGQIEKHMVHIKNTDDIKNTDIFSKEKIKDSASPVPDVLNSSYNETFQLVRTKFPPKSIQERVKEKIGPKKEITIPKLHPIIDYMNNRLPGMKMKGFKPNGSKYKNYDNAIRYINQLMSGTHGKFWKLEKEYIEKVGISTSILSHQFTEKEIKQTISRMRGLYEETNYPKNKKWFYGISRDMLFYHSGTQDCPASSFFLDVYVNGVQEMREVSLQKQWNESPYKKQAEKICELFEINGNWGLRAKVLKNINEIVKFRRFFPDDNKVDYHTGDKTRYPQGWIEDYIDKILATNEGSYYREKQDISCLSPKSKAYRQYIRFYWNENQVDLPYGLSYYLDSFLYGQQYANKRQEKESRKDEITPEQFEDWLYS